MSDSSSFEDMFESFGTSLRLSKHKSPSRTPKSTSEMRKHTTFASQGLPGVANGDSMYTYNTSKMAAVPAKNLHQSRMRLMANAQKSQFRIKGPAAKTTSKPMDARMFSNWNNSSSA